ncbi:MAG: GNAT family N-acetyltransferase [Phycisphaeraceae bacterium]|nr:GNAT family N-acetyltransferase [Phycisphaeraceae bacterium]
MTNLLIRPATADDVPLILRFITDLAIYEKAEHEVVATEDDLRRTLFGGDSTAHALIGLDGGIPVGFAVYFFNYSTWLGRNGLFLEDLYVSPEHRGRGAGKTMLRHLARIAVERGCGRLEWNVIDWNEPAIRFYEALGARPQNEWVGYRLAGSALQELAGGA